MQKENKKFNFSNNLEGLYRVNSKKESNLTNVVVNDNIIKKKSEQIDEYFYVSMYTPPKDSISELVFEEDIDLMKQKIVENTTFLNKRDELGNTASWTPLYWAVKYDKIECVKVLLEHGADINVIINDPEECCGTVLDLAILRNNLEMENLLRDYADKEEINFGQSFKAIRTKLRGKSPAFNFKNYAKKAKEE